MKEWPADQRESDVIRADFSSSKASSDTESPILTSIFYPLSHFSHISCLGNILFVFMCNFVEGYS